MIHRDEGGVYFLASPQVGGPKLSTVINGLAAFGVGVYSDLQGKLVLTISHSPFSFHEHLSASEARLLGNALLDAAYVLEQEAIK